MMTKYMLKRFLASILTILFVMTVTFFLLRLMPGSPFTSERISPEILKNMQAKYGMDKPLMQQYFTYMGNALRGDFGESMVYTGKRVTQDIIFTFFPNSLKLGAVSLIYSVVLGLFLGIVSAFRQGKWQDKTANVFATLSITIPSFVISALLIYFFGVKLKLLPPTGFSSWKNYIMPVLALSSYSLAYISKLTRAKLIEVMRSDYIRTAKAKGLGSNVVMLKHALRNSLIPVVTVLGPLSAYILTGSFVVETIFAIPGLGSEFVHSVSNRDYTTVMGITTFLCSFIIFCTFVVDLLYVAIDPRIKLENTNN